MNIINKFMKLKTWKKIGIAIGLLSIFKYFTMGSIITEVKAETYEQPGIIFVDTQSGLPIANPGLEGTLPFLSNFVPTENINKWVNSGRQPMNARVYWKNFNNNNEYNTQDSTLYGVINENTNIMNPNINGSNIGTNYLTSFNMFQEHSYGNSNGGIGPIHKNATYTIVWVLYGDGVEFSKGISSKDNIRDFNLDISYCTPRYGNEDFCQGMYSMIDWEIELVNSNELTYNNPHVAFLKLTFTTNNLFPTGDTFYIDNITISSKNGVISQGDTISQDFKYMVKADNGRVGGFTFDAIYITTDMEVLVGQNQESIDAYNDYFQGKLINTINDYETCDSLDIACHVRNIMKSIKNFMNNILYSLKALLSYVFIPNWDFINNYIDQTNQMMTSKYPDIQALEDYINYFNSRLSTLTRETTISFPGVKWPFDNNNTYIIPAFTYDFSTIINDNRIGPYYSIGRVVIIAMVSIWWGVWLINWLKSILHNTPKIDM